MEYFTYFIDAHIHLKYLFKRKEAQSEQLDNLREQLDNLRKQVAPFVNISESTIIDKGGDAQ